MPPIYFARTCTAYDRMLSRAFRLRRIEMTATSQTQAQTQAQTKSSPRAPDNKSTYKPSDRTSELIAALSKIAGQQQKISKEVSHA